MMTNRDTVAASRPHPPTVAARQSRGRLFLIENCPIVGNATAALINAEKDLELCGMADSGPSALQKLGALRPDLVVLGTSLQGRDGLDLLKEIKASFPGQRVLVFSIDDEALFAPRAIREGAAGYVMKQEPTATLLAAIRRVLSGRSYISAQLEEQTRQLGAGPQPGSMLHPLEKLSGRQLEIFRLVGQGKKRRDIARLLGLTVKAVDHHRGQIKEKLCLKNASDLIRHAIEMEHEASGTLQEPKLDKTT